MKKFLMSLGLAFVLLFTLAVAPANATAKAAEECKHENEKIQYYLDGEKPETCLEEAIAKLVCEDCGRTIYQKVQGEHKIETEVIDATCTTPQKVVEKCEYCDYVQFEQELSKATGHEWKEAAKVPATCTTPAGVAKVCTKCGAKENFVADEGAKELGHDYGKAVKVAATCVTEGYEKQTCSRCGDVKTTKTTDIDPEAHEKELIETLVEATCEKDGVGKYACKYCKKELTYTNIPAGHEWEVIEDETLTYGETCKNDGKITRVCKKCNDLVTEVIASDPEKHVFEELINEYVAPTCGTEGKKVFYCTECGKLETTILPIDSKAEHDLAEEVVDATCEKPQLVKVYCKNCKTVISEEPTVDDKGNYTQALGHTPGEKVNFEATCEKGSGYTITCKRCNEVIESKENDDAKGHSWVKGEVVKATCHDKGYTTYTCSVCKETKQDDETAIDPTNHVSKLAKTIQEPTCTVPGVGKYVCQYCEDKAAWYASIPAQHSWNEGKVTTAATCTEEGVKTYTCNACGETKTEKIAKIAHSYVADKEASYAATCDKDGLEVKVCSVCGDKQTKALTDRPKHNYVEKVLEANCLLPQRVGEECTACGGFSDKYYAVENGDKALGHDYEVKHIAATCTQDAGYSKKCTRCNDETKYIAFVKGENGYKAALGHDVKTYTKAATCVAVGEKYDYCGRCNKKLTESSELAIDKNNHTVNLEKTLLAATCTVAGVGKYSCILCGENTIYQSIPAEHKWDKGTVTTAATCTKKGVKTITCTVCDQTKTEEIETVDCKMVADTAASYAATCGKDGLKVEKCSVCGKETETVLKATGKHNMVEKVIDADCENPQRVGRQCSVCGTVDKNASEVIGSTKLGHDWEEIIVEASCLKGNGWYKKCSRCDKKEDVVYYEATDKEYVAPLGHDFEAQEIAATCVKTGKTWEACSRCDETRNEVEVAINPNNHANEKCTKVLKEATCTEPGVGKYECSDCKKVYYQSIPAGHTWGAEKVLTAATCGKAGKAERTCTECGKAEEYTIAATGKHDVETITVAATCTKEGSVTKKCKVCGTVISTTKKPMVSHDYSKEEIQPATCTELAYVVFKCATCGKPDSSRKEPVKDSKYADHDLVEVHEDATCEHNERMHITCKNCKLNKYEDVENGVQSKGHKFVEKKQEATCTTKAKTWEQCEYCNKVKEGSTVEGDYNKDNHEWKLVSTLREATCTTAGVGKYQCANENCKVNAIYKVIEASHDWPEDGEEVSGNIVYCSCKVADCKYVKILSLVGAYEEFQLSTTEYESLEAAEKAVKAIMDQVISFTNVEAKITGKVNDEGKLELTITTSNDLKGYSNVWVEINGEKLEAVSGKFTYVVNAPAEGTVYEVRYCAEVAGASATSKGKLAMYTYTTK